MNKPGALKDPPNRTPPPDMETTIMGYIGFRVQVFLDPVGGLGSLVVMA